MPRPKTKIPGLRQLQNKKRVNAATKRIAERRFVKIYPDSYSVKPLPRDKRPVVDYFKKRLRKVTKELLQERVTSSPP